MATVKELEARVEQLEKRLAGASPEEPNWVRDKKQCNTAAKALIHAFEWEEAPNGPQDFETWKDLYDWLQEIGEDF